MYKLLIAVIAGAFLLSACGKKVSSKSKEAIQGAIVTHLKGRPNLSMANFDTTVKSVKFEGDTAEAVAEFVSKGEPHSAFEMRYHLKMDGGVWKVVSGEPVGGHSMGMGMGAGQGGAAGSMPMGQPAPGEKSQTSPVPESSH